MNHNQVTATIHDTSERAADWRGIFHRLDNIPLQGPLPILCNLPGKGEQWVYLLDLTVITPDERQRLIEHIAGRFHLPCESVERGLDETGVPIVADDLLVTVPAGMALAMLDDWDDDEEWLDDQLRPFEAEGWREDQEDDDDDDF